MTPDERLRRTAAANHGVLSRADVRDAGLTDRQLRIRVDSGQLHRKTAKVFVAAGTPSTPQQRLLVATLALDAAACDASASWLHGLRDSPPLRPHVVRRTRSGARSGDAVLHRRADLLASDLVRVQGIRTTNATRTLLDMAATIDDAPLKALIAEAIRRGLTHQDRLIARHLMMPGTGRQGSTRARRVLRQLDADLALLDSDLEHRLLRLITDHGLPRPVPQFCVEVEGSHYRIDFAYPDRCIAIEGDGFRFHSDPVSFEHDRARQNQLVLSGWRVLRFTWRQICAEPDRVAAQISAALG